MNRAVTDAYDATMVHAQVNKMCVILKPDSAQPMMFVTKALTETPSLLEMKLKSFLLPNITKLANMSMTNDRLSHTTKQQLNSINDRVLLIGERVTRSQ